MPIWRTVRRQTKKSHSAGSIVVAIIIAFHQPIVTSGRNVFLVQANVSSAKYCLPVTVQMLEVQLHQARIVEIGCEVVSGAEWISAHADDSIPNLGRQMFDMLWIPGIVVTNLTSASNRARLIAK